MTTQTNSNFIDKKAIEKWRNRYDSAVQTDVNTALNLYQDHFVTAYQFPEITKVSKLAELIDNPKQFLIETLASGFADNDLKRGIFTIDRHTAANQIYESLQFKPLYDPDSDGIKAPHMESPIHFLAYLRKRNTSGFIYEFADFLDIVDRQVVFNEGKFQQYCIEKFSITPRTQKEKEFVELYQQYMNSVEGLMKLGATLDDVVRPWGHLFDVENRKPVRFPYIFQRVFPVNKTA